jgi:hypothetical protein
MPSVKSCTESSGDTCEADDDPVRTLGKGSQDPEFQKEYPKLIGEDPIRVMPDEMEERVMVI